MKHDVVQCVCQYANGPSNPKYWIYRRMLSSIRNIGEENSFAASAFSQCSETKNNHPSMPIQAIHYVRTIDTKCSLHSVQCTGVQRTMVLCKLIKCFLPYLFVLCAFDSANHLNHPFHSKSAGNIFQATMLFLENKFCTIFA